MLSKLIILLPLISFLFSISLRRKFKTQVFDFFTSILIILSAILSIILFFHIGQKVEVINLFTWIDIGFLSANWAIYIDKLSSIMLVIITLVSSLVHIYSIGYMKNDDSKVRFMSYLSLFTFFMIVLVTSANLLQLFFGWEGVGLASYLLIGFWFKKESANKAAIKAFVVNRVGDVGLIIAISLVFLTFGSIKFVDIFSQVETHLESSFLLLGTKISAIDMICILLFIGAVGKSAQIGLHVWLADAMEGPTPVSALIHAATMVTAGVFLLARFSPILEYSKISLSIITIVGALTAIFAATIAITQTDIKKIIAYSTCSQLGYMFFACGLSAYSAAIFHLATHAFFKALLFLGAGSIIYAVHHEQNITKMGGLYKKLPFTHIMMWIATLALLGFPPFGGFYSKDVILEVAYMSSGNFSDFAFYIGIITAFLTSFYSYRLIFMVFYGKSNNSTLSNIKEPPKTMLIPLGILSFGSIFSGIYGYHFLNIVSESGNLFDGSIFSLSNNRILEEIHHTPFLIKKLPLILGLLALSISYILYIKRPDLPSKLSRKLLPIYNLSFKKWYFDELYNLIFVRSIYYLSKKFWLFLDKKIIDGYGPNALVLVCKKLSKKISYIQTGYLQHYFLVMIIGIIIILSYIITTSYINIT